jgi:ABC-type Mn2+/Zn2+ transport system permease subunit
MIRVGLAIISSTLYFKQVISVHLAFVLILIVGILIIVRFLHFIWHMLKIDCFDENGHRTGGLFVGNRLRNYSPKDFKE